MGRAAPSVVRVLQASGQKLLKNESISSQRWEGECFLFPREGLLSWRIPFRGPRDKYLLVCGLSGRRMGGETKMRFLFSPFRGGAVRLGFRRRAYSVG